MRLGFGAGESLRHGECICGLSKAIQGSERSMRRREAEQKLRRYKAPEEVFGVDCVAERRDGGGSELRGGSNGGGGGLR